MTDVEVQTDTDIVQDDSMSKLERQFWRYHRDHPDVYAELSALAFQAHMQGKGKVSIKMLWEVMRWHRYLAGKPASLSNGYTAFYARLLMKENRRLRGVFTTRTQRHHKVVTKCE